MSTTAGSEPEYWAEQDLAFLRMTQGASFGQGVTLPSGRYVSGDDLAAMQRTLNQIDAAAGAPDA
jgi:hypothetical protein